MIRYHTHDQEHTGHSMKSEKRQLFRGAKKGFLKGREKSRLEESAEGRNRTGMILLSLDFESSASTNFATSA
jgi:hypothetical protein